MGGGSDVGGDGGGSEDGATFGLTQQAPKFEEAEFVASLGEFKFLASGQLRLVLNVPFPQRANALPMSDAYGLALQVRVTRKRRKERSDG